MGEGGGVAGGSWFRRVECQWRAGESLKFYKNTLIGNRMFRTLMRTFECQRPDMIKSNNLSHQ